MDRLGLELRPLRGWGVQPWMIILVYALCGLVFLLVHGQTVPYDDSYFFKRVAVHALSHGTLAWNVDEGPVYGNTSLGWQAVAVMVQWLVPHHYMMVMRLVTWAVTVAAFAMLHRLTRTWDGALAVTMAFASPLAFYPLLSGMETGLMFCALAWVAWLVFAPGVRANAWPVLAAALVVVYLVRPDACLVAMAMVVAGYYTGTVIQPWRTLALAALLLALVWLACRCYFGTALPLPFYAKQSAFSPYDAHFRELSYASGLARFYVFALFALPLVLVALAQRDAANRVLLLGVAAHALYHRMFTIDVMGMHGRFYLPELPVLVIAGARGLFVLSHGHHKKISCGLALGYLAFFCTLLGFERLPPHSSFDLDRMPWLVTILYVAALTLTLLASAFPQWLPRAARIIVATSVISHLPLFGHARLHWYSDDEFLSAHARRYTTYRGLDTLHACFGDAIDVYHSEIGVPGLRFIAGKVTDLAGLMSPLWLFRSANSFDTLCQADRPSAIFLPHRNYVELNREIVNGQCIKGYHRVVEKSSSALFVRQDLAPRYFACAADRRDPWVVQVEVRPGQ